MESSSSNGIMPAMLRAGKIQSRLGTERPSCIKMVVKPHVDPGHWMGFSQMFGKSFLPRQDCGMEIEAENGQIYHIRYVAQKTGISEGWKEFAAANNLHEGDVMVFHLLQPNKFKVYVVRENGPNQVAYGLQVSRPNLSFEELQNFQDFHIMVKGACVDSELPEDVRMLYYKLCIYRKESLHDSVPVYVNSTLVVGMIGETIKIASEIKNCKFATTTAVELETWDTTLSSFVMIGMKVEFLRDRIRRLLSIVVESQGELNVPW